MNDKTTSTIKHCPQRRTRVSNPLTPAITHHTCTPSTYFLTLQFRLQSPQTLAPHKNLNSELPYSASASKSSSVSSLDVAPNLSQSSNKTCALHHQSAPNSHKLSTHRGHSRLRNFHVPPPLPTQRNQPPLRPLPPEPNHDLLPREQRHPHHLRLRMVRHLADIPHGGR